MSSLQALCHHKGHLPIANLKKGGGVRGPVAGDQLGGHVGGGPQLFSYSIIPSVNSSHWHNFTLSCS